MENERNRGWLRLWRKLDASEVFNDEKALRVFIWLLCNVDRNTESIRIGRFWVAECLKINPNTLKDIFKRLEQKYKIINMESTNKYTTITLVNWAKYQNPEIDTNKTPQSDTTNKQLQTLKLDTTKITDLTPTKHQQNTTLQEVIIKETINNKRDKINESLDKIILDILTHWNEKYETRYKGIKPLRNNVSYWLGTYSIDEIKISIDNIPYDEWWKDKMTPETLFRRRSSKGDEVDYIGKLLNAKTNNNTGNDGLPPGFKLAKPYAKS